MTLHHFIYLPLIFIMMSSLACESTEEAQEVDMEIPRQPRPRPVYKDDPWFEKAVVEGGGVGLHTQLEVSPNGKVGVAYWSTDGVEGEPCSGLDVDDPPLEVRWGLHYAQWSDETGWEPELVSQPLLLGIPPGLDLDYQRTGRPVIAALAGDPVPEIKYCGGSDLGLFTPSTNSNAEEWDVSWVVTDSDQAMSGEAASDFGYVVGYWPSIAKSSSGARMAVYQDVHAGSLQRDDLSRADLEVAFQDSEGSSWSYEVIDLGEGAGIYNRAVYAEDDSPVVLYYISIEAAQEERVRQGIWVARRVNGEWKRALVFGGPTKGTPSMIAYQGGVAIAYYDPQIRHPVIARLKNLNELERGRVLLSEVFKL